MILLPKRGKQQSKLYSSVLETVMEKMGKASLAIEI